MVEIAADRFTAGDAIHMAVLCDISPEIPSSGRWGNGCRSMETIRRTDTYCHDN